MLAWLTDPSIIALAESFGGTPPKTDDLAEIMDWFLDFSDKWDFRKDKRAFDKDLGEGARWLIPNMDLGKQENALILEVSKELGLIGVETPPRDDYDYVLVLGGARMSCLLRTKLAGQIIKEWPSPPKAVALLSSMRPVSDSERSATDTYAPEANTEFDLFIAASKEELDLHNYETVATEEGSEVRRYETSSVGCPVFVLASESSSSERPANSDDTYNFFFDRLEIPEGQKLLLVTSQIEVPYQNMEAIRSMALPHKVEALDIVGFPEQWNEEFHESIAPENYLQEIRSTIQSMKRFLNQYG
jgi:hypothetical protein